MRVAIILNVYRRERNKDIQQKVLTFRMKETGKSTTMRRIWLFRFPGLADGEEIIPTFSPYRGGYYYYHSNPNNPDTDGDYRKDGDEKGFEVSQYNFTQHLGVFFSTLAYENIESDVKNAGKSGLSLSKTSNSKITDKMEELNIKQSQHKGWKIIDAEDSHLYDTGFGALALKKVDILVFAYRGTDILEIPNDFFISDLSIGLFNNNWTTPIANRFAADNILNQKNYENLQLNVTGHSLGGGLAQVVSYGIMENKLYDDVINGQKKDDIKELLSINNMLGHAYTYNSAPFFFTSGLVGVFLGKIPYKAIFDTKYNPYITNYSIAGDPLSRFVPNLGERIGADPAPYFEKTIDANSHTIRQFYTIFYQ